MKNKSKRILEKLYVNILLAFILLPFMIIFVWSFVDKWRFPNLIPKSFSLRVIESFLKSDTETYTIVFSSIIFSLIVSISSTIIAILTSRAIVFYDFKVKKLVEGFVFMPLIVPSAALVMGIQVLFIRLGIYDTYVGVFVVHLIYSLPYSITLILAAIQKEAKSLEMQAMVLGASRLQAFFYVSLPNIKSALITSLCISYVISFSQYFITLIIGGGVVKTYNVIIVPIIQNSDRSLASVYSVIFIISTFIVFLFIKLVIEFIFRKRKKTYDIRYRT